MPKVTIMFDPFSGEYLVEEFSKVGQANVEYEVVMDMKASHFINMQRNLKRFQRDQDALAKFFIEVQAAGHPIREC